MNEDFRQMIEAEKSDVFNGLFSALNSEPATGVRINPLKTSPHTLPAIIGNAAKVPWNKWGYLLQGRPCFTLDPQLHQGVYYVQEPSSMITGHIMNVICALEGYRPLRVLDSCAAPGGKTTALLSELPEGSAVIANEYDYKRAEILRENIEKWGHPSVAVSRGDTARFSKMGGCFDVILADMPCSGEGMFRKDAAAVRQWTPALVEQCAGRQRQIMENLVPALAPGGYIIYSTCTFNTAENEKNIGYICRRHGLETISVSTPAAWNIEGAVNSDVSCMRFMPSRLEGEGLFVAVMRRCANNMDTVGNRSRKNHIPPKKKDSVPDQVLRWTKGLFLTRRADILWGAAPALHTLLGLAEDKGVELLTYGVEVARIKGHDIAPSHALALSEALESASFPRVDVDRDTALRYLRRETPAPLQHVPAGYVLLYYLDRPLGFVKNLGNRVNNLFPKEWRIRI